MCSLDEAKPFVRAYSASGEKPATSWTNPVVTGSASPITLHKLDNGLPCRLSYHYPNRISPAVSW